MRQRHVALRAMKRGISFDDSPSIDAFGHLRVSNPEAIMTVLCQYDKEPLTMESGATGSGIVPEHNTSTRMVRLRAAAGTGTSFMQSYTYWSYQPGRSQRVELTGKFGAPVVGSNTEFGYFDADNGFIYRHQLEGVSFVLRSKTSGAVVDTVIPQVQWNLDTLDGQGPSGEILDTSKVFILTMDFEFLGMGRVRMGFNIGGSIIYAHEFLHSNVLNDSYMQTATLPVQILLTTTASVAESEAHFKGALVMSEGGLLKELGYTFATPRHTVSAVNGIRTHLMTLRPKLLFNGLANRESYVTRSLDIFTKDKPVFWELVAGANFSAAPTFTDVNPQFSGTEVGSGGTFSNLTGGVVLRSGFAVGSEATPVHVPLDLRHPLVLNRAGQHTSLGSLSLLVQGIDGAVDTHAAISFTELR